MQRENDQINEDFVDIYFEFRDLLDKNIENFKFLTKSTASFVDYEDKASELANQISLNLEEAFRVSSSTSYNQFQDLLLPEKLKVIESTKRLRDQMGEVQSMIRHLSGRVEESSAPKRATKASIISTCSTELISLPESRRTIIPVPTETERTFTDLDQSAELFRRSIKPEMREFMEVAFKTRERSPERFRGTRKQIREEVLEAVKMKKKLLFVKKEKMKESLLLRLRLELAGIFETAQSEIIEIEGRTVGRLSDEEIRSNFNLEAFRRGWRQAFRSEIQQSEDRKKAPETPRAEAREGEDENIDIPVSYEEISDQQRSESTAPRQREDSFQIENQGEQRDEQGQMYSKTFDFARQGPSGHEAPHRVSFGTFGHCETTSTGKEGTEVEEVSEEKLITYNSLKTVSFDSYTRNGSLEAAMGSPAKELSKAQSLRALESRGLGPVQIDGISLEEVNLKLNEGLKKFKSKQLEMRKEKTAMLEAGLARFQSHCSRRKTRLLDMVNQVLEAFDPPAKKFEAQLMTPSNFDYSPISLIGRASSPRCEKSCFSLKESRKSTGKKRPKKSNRAKKRRSKKKKKKKDEFVVDKENCNDEPKRSFKKRLVMSASKISLGESRVKVDLRKSCNRSPQQLSFRFADLGLEDSEIKERGTLKEMTQNSDSKHKIRIVKRPGNL